MDNWQEQIAIDPKTMAGKAVVKGTRVTVERVLYLLGQALTTDQILTEYPQLTARDIQACLLYGSQLAGSEDVIPLPEQRSA